MRVLFAAAAVVLTACGNSVAPGASFERYSYTNESGTRTYKVYVPTGVQAKAAMPLIVELHGCGGNADEEARWSRFNALADAHGFLAVYPEQDAAANGSR